MIVELFKLAHQLDKKAKHDLAGDVDKLIEELTQRAGINPEEMVSLADYLDEQGEVELASKFDNMLKAAAKKPYKGPGEKPPKGAESKAPKKWFDEKKKEVKKGNPDYSEKEVNMTVGDIWDNKLSDKERTKINKKYRG